MEGGFCPLLPRGIALFGDRVSLYINSASPPPLCFDSHLLRVANYPKNSKSFKRREYNVFYLSKGNMGLKNNCKSMFLIVASESNTRHTPSSFYISGGSYQNGRLIL